MVLCEDSRLASELKVRDYLHASVVCVRKSLKFVYNTQIQIITLDVRLKLNLVNCFRNWRLRFEIKIKFVNTYQYCTDTSEIKPSPKATWSMSHQNQGNHNA